METFAELATITADQLKRWAEIVGGKPWGAEKGRPRIYMPTRRDCKVYFDFPDFPTGDEKQILGGARFQCFIDNCGQHPHWYQSQRQMLMVAHYKTMLALSALAAYDEQLARDIMELAEVDADMLDEAGGHLCNGRTAEAREVIFGTQCQLAEEEDG